MELTHHVLLKYEAILHKQFNYAPSYAEPIQAKIAEMVAAGKTDGQLYFLSDDVTVARNFIDSESATEWANWIFDYNATHPDVTILSFIVVSEKFQYANATSQTDDDARAVRAAALVAQLSST